MTLKYYQTHAKEFFENTINVDMHDLYERYLKFLESGDRILDIGCGSGRDTKVFNNLGFKLEAFDASSELVLKAKEATGIDVIEATFDTYESNQLFDGMWACASLLHVPKNELSGTIRHLASYLAPNGYWYMSFKYGHSEREVSGRYFNDMNEQSLAELIQGNNDLSIVETWINEDKRPEKTEIWLNAIVQKKGKQ
jgi:2-polyprenyl-3-methyl-5-hydroxy-6-metoxy-1,4-benzoquinol methylase